MNAVADYFRAQQIPLQWAPILRALAAELDQQSDPQALRSLFAAVGRRYAAEMASQFQGMDSLADLNQACNALWARTDWGYVTMTEADEWIDIEHNCAPLSNAFGPDALEWSVGLLEGFYQTVFRLLGADERLVAKFINDENDGLSLHLRFGQAQARNTPITGGASD